MVIRGRVKNGVIVLDDPSALPEGAEVSVSYPAVPRVGSKSAAKRIEVPLVRTGEPGSVYLTGERIAEILDEEDASPRH